MSGKKRLLVLIAGIALGGCAGSIKSDVTRFHDLGAETPRGTFAIVAHPDQRDSLEFKNYSRMLAGQIVRHNLVEVEDPANADYVVKFRYGMGAGESTVVSSPVYGQTGAVYTGPGQIQPTYGIVGTSTSTVTTYTRHAEIDMFRRSRVGDLKKVHETKIVSRGPTDALTQVLPYMLEAAFKTFPGRSGETESVVVEMRPD
jgi:hypothetical protein